MSGSESTAVVAVAPLDDLSHWARGSGLEIVLLVVGAILLARFTSWVGGQVIARIDEQARGDDVLVRSEAAKHRHAVAQVAIWTAIVLIYTLAGILVVTRFGVPLTSLVAPATVAGVALGFGAQRIVQDILAGFFILAERQYGFGDVIRIAALGSTTGVSGTVEDVTLRVTRMRTANGEVVIVPNGQIVQVTNLSRDWARAVVDVPIPSTADVSRVTDVLHRVCAEAYDDDDLRPLLLDAPSVMGVESLEVTELTVRVVARTLPGKQFEVGRELRQRVAVALLSEGITTSTTVDADPTPGAS